MGVVKTWNGIARASVKTFDGIAVASVKTINGYDATTGGVTYLLSEDFEGPGYQNSWTESSVGAGSIDAANTEYPTHGSYGLKIVRSGTTITIYTDLASTATKVGFFQSFRTSSASVNAAICEIRASDGTVLATASIRSTGAIRLTVGGATATTSGTISIDTDYYMWGYVDFDAGTFNIEFQTTPTQSGSGSNYASASGGTTGVTAGRFAFSLASNQSRWYDWVRVNSTAIGDSPA